MTVTSYAKTDKGLLRDFNEDTFYVNDELGIYAVCDGMGGHRAGEVAAERAPKIFADYLGIRKELLADVPQSQQWSAELRKLAEQAFQEACRQIYRLAASDPSLAGMGTTMTAMMVVDNKAVLAHVGDCRLYLFRNAEIHLLTSDHTLTNEMVMAGVLDAENATTHPWSHVVTRSIGHHEAVQVDTLVFDLLPGDTFLLCSDGLSRYFKRSAQIGEHLDREDLSAVPRQLINFAKSRGGKDNITAMVLRVESARNESAAWEAQDSLNVLGSILLFQGLSLNRLMRILNISQVRSYDAHQTVISEADTCNGIHIVLSGRISARKNEAQFREFSSGQFFGDAALARPIIMNTTMRAAEATRILFIDRASFKKLVRRFPKLGVRLQNRLLKHLCADRG